MKTGIAANLLFREYNPKAEARIITRFEHSIHSQISLGFQHLIHLGSPEKMSLSLLWCNSYLNFLDLFIVKSRIANDQYKHKHIYNNADHSSAASGEIERGLPFGSRTQRGEHEHPRAQWRAVGPVPGCGSV